MEFYINETSNQGYSGYNILLDPTHEMEQMADEIQKAKGKIPLFDDTGEYDNEDWYDFYLTCDENGVKEMYFTYGISDEYGDEIELSELDKLKAWKAVLEFFGGIKGYKKYLEEVS